MKTYLRIVVLLLSLRTACPPADPIIGVFIDADPHISVVVVPRDDKRYEIGVPFMQIAGSGAAWDRNSGELELEAPDIEKYGMGFDLIDELKTGTLNIGFPADQVAQYLKEAKGLGIDGSFASTLSFYPIDSKATVIMKAVDLAKYKVVKIQEIGATKDRMITFFKAIKDLSLP